MTDQYNVIACTNIPSTTPWPTTTISPCGSWPLLQTSSTSGRSVCRGQGWRSATLWLWRAGEWPGRETLPCPPSWRRWRCRWCRPASARRRCPRTRSLTTCCVPGASEGRTLVRGTVEDLSWGSSRARSKSSWQESSPGVWAVLTGDCSGCTLRCRNIKDG